jgi:hypothetical protein
MNRAIIFRKQNIQITITVVISHGGPTYYHFVVQNTSNHLVCIGKHTAAVVCKQL